MAYTPRLRDRTGSFCASCPLAGRRKVPAALPPAGAAHAGIVLLGEAPAAAEEARGEPFIGPSGSLLTAALSRADLRRDRLWITNAASCRFTEDDVKRHDSLEALDCCAAGLRAELKAAWDSGYRVIVALGQTALEACGIEGKIGAWRGSVTKPGDNAALPPFKIVPAYHPAAIPHWSGSGRGTADPFLTLVADLEKARDVADGKWTVPAEHFNLDPSFKEVCQWFERMADERPLFGCDIETDGLSRFNSEPVVIGFATSEADALVLPLRVRGRDDLVWSSTEWGILKPRMDLAFERGYSIFQNAAFDVPFLRYKGFRLPVDAVEHDTFLLHSVVAPEEPHNLGYITSQFGATSYWKDVFKNRPGSIYEMEPEEMRRYNARDSVVLMQIIPRLREKAEKLGLYDEYVNVTMPLFRYGVVEMEETGVPFDYERLEDFGELLDDLIERKETRMRDLLQLPREFELRNSQHLAWLLYGWKPAWTARVDAEYAKRVDGIQKVGSKLELLRTQMDGTKMKPATREKRIAQAEASMARQSSTAEFAKWRDLKHLSDNMHCPWVPSSWDPPATDKGGVSTDKEALLSLTIKLQNDLAERDDRVAKHDATIDRLKAEGKHDTKAAQHAADLLATAEFEAESIQSVLTFLEEMRDLAEYTKLKEAFTKYKPAPDGRIHPWWNAGGAATGRLSCSGPNLMQIPHGDEKKPNDPANEIRRFVRAEFGQVLVSGDFENAEVMLFGAETEDPIILDAYYSGKNIHDINTRTLFAVDKDSPLWGPGRMAAKKMQFGRYQYGSGLRTMFRKILLECPGLNLTFSQLEEADRRWWEAHPSAKAWDERMTALALKDRIVYNEFGRARIFLGNAGDVPRAAKNFRIQSACASIINRATLRILKRRDTEAPHAKMVMQVHDQVIFMAPADEAPVMARVIREELERPFMYKGVERYLRAGMEWGPSYGEFVDLEGPVPAVVPEDRVETPERRSAWKKAKAKEHLAELVA